MILLRKSLTGMLEDGSHATAYVEYCVVLEKKNGTEARGPKTQLPFNQHKRCIPLKFCFVGDTRIWKKKISKVCGSWIFVLRSACVNAIENWCTKDEAQTKIVEFL